VRLDDFPGGFLVRTAEDEVYFLYVQRSDLQSTFSDCRWVLSFRILRDREVMAFYRDERKMLVNVTVKRVADFHGHLCPELVIGMKACEYAQELFFTDEQPKGRLSVVAENGTSALDAFQVLLGVTMGNQCLKILDVGKHNYRITSREAGKCFILRLKPPCFDDEHEYTVLEGKTRRNRITLDEVVDLQKLLDGRVQKLLAAHPKELFEVEEVCAVPQTLELAPAYVSCSGCGEQVLQERVVPFGDKFYCVPCFQLLNGTEKGQSLH